MNAVITQPVYTENFVSAMHMSSPTPHVEHLKAEHLLEHIGDAADCMFQAASNLRRVAKARPDLHAALEEKINSISILKGDLERIKGAEHRNMCGGLRTGGPDA